MGYRVIKAGAESRSFPDGSDFIRNSSETANVVVLIGPDSGKALREVPDIESKDVILVELGTECLGVHTGESRGKEGSNILGFNRFRLGDDAPSDLVELVRQPHSSEAALNAAKQLFTDAGLEVSVCGDFAGRIIDRLVRPYYNESLRRLDEGLATAEDLDLTLKLGLGYPEGPIELLERSGLDAHYDVTKPLFDVYGERAYAPARRALVAKQRKQG
ncbi:3-hydroxyacyl-CoA dehydrogenase [Marinobacter sp. Z-F4-2]|nr:3-hydroxyacyl-CoA dehydrogenase [Marinobacter sp. Z-F4-2]